MQDIFCQNKARLLLSEESENCWVELSGLKNREDLLPSLQGYVNGELESSNDEQISQAIVSLVSSLYTPFTLPIKHFVILKFFLCIKWYHLIHTSRVKWYHFVDNLCVKWYHFINIFVKK